MSLVRKAASLAFVALALLSAGTPALAAAKAKAPLVDKNGLPLQAPPKPPDKDWEGACARVVAKLHNGMSSDDVIKAFLKEQAGKHAQPAVFDSKTVHDFNVTKGKRRIYFVIGYFRLDSVPTHHKAVLAFESPQGDYTGGHAKLVNKVVLTDPQFPHPGEIVIETVPDRGVIQKKIHWKFKQPF